MLFFIAKMQILLIIGKNNQNIDKQKEKVKNHLYPGTIMS